MKQDNTIKLTGLIIVGVLALSLIIVLAVYNFEARSTINVEGTGDVEVMPDIVSINFRIQTNGETSAQAKSNNDEITNKVIESLILQGFSREEIQTKNLYVSEEYDWSKETRELTGYVASHYVIVEMSTENTEKISLTLDAGINAGATLDYISYSLSEELEKEVRKEAIAKASINAQEKAQDMAIGLGSKLGRIVQISESYNNGYYPLYRAESLAMDSGTGNIQPQEQTQTASVTVVYEIR